MWPNPRKGGKFFQASTLRQILLMTDSAFWFVYFEGRGGRGCLSQSKVQGNDRNDSFSREAGAHSHPILSQVSCVKITTKFLEPPFFYPIYFLSLLNMNRILKKTSFIQNQASLSCPVN